MVFPALVELPTLYSVCHLLPYVGNIGTNGITNGTIGKTLNGIYLPMVPFLPLEKTTNARIICPCVVVFRRFVEFFGNSVDHIGHEHFLATVDFKLSYLVGPSTKFRVLT